MGPNFPGAQVDTPPKQGKLNGFGPQFFRKGPFKKNVSEKKLDLKGGHGRCAPPPWLRLWLGHAAIVANDNRFFLLEMLIIC